MGLCPLYMQLGQISGESMSKGFVPSERDLATLIAMAKCMSNKKPLGSLPATVFDGLFARVRVMIGSRSWNGMECTTVRRAMSDFTSEEPVTGLVSIVMDLPMGGPSALVIERSDHPILFDGRAFAEQAGEHRKLQLLRLRITETIRHAKRPKHPMHVKKELERVIGPTDVRGEKSELIDFIDESKHDSVFVSQVLKIPDWRKRATALLLLAESGLRVLDPERSSANVVEVAFSVLEGSSHIATPEILRNWRDDPTSLVLGDTCIVCAALLHIHGNEVFDLVHKQMDRSCTDLNRHDLWSLCRLVNVMTSFPLVSL